MGYVEAMTETILRIKNLNKRYGGQNGQRIILKDVNLEVARREFLCILGPSGCGKTTLLRCIAGFEDYTGEIYVNEKLRKKPGIDRIMVFQDFNQLFPWKTVEMNIQYPLKLQGIKDKTVLQKASDEALEKVRLSGYGKYYPHELSGGMKQRVAIAKALALKPEIILMDEPFAALDAMTRTKLQKELLTISENENSTFLFVTHNIQESIMLSSRILLFGQEGKVLVDEMNTLPKPVTPATEGYGPFWDNLREALYSA